jgi:hypothetical protein
MAPQITPEMWGYMAGLAALEKAAKPTFKKKKQTAAERKMNRAHGEALKEHGKRGRGSAKATSKLYSGAKKQIGRIGRLAKKHWKPLAAGAGLAAAAGGAYAAHRARKGDDEAAE